MRLGQCEELGHFWRDRLSVGLISAVHSSDTSFDICHFSSPFVPIWHWVMDLDIRWHVCLWFWSCCSCRHVNHNSLDYINSLADLQVYLLLYCCACPRYVVQPQHAGCSVTKREGRLADVIGNAGVLEKHHTNA